MNKTSNCSILEVHENRIEEGFNGGKDSIYQWQLLPNSTFFCYQHCSCVIPGTNSIALFGGYGETKDSKNHGRLNSLLLLDTNTNEMRYLPQEGEAIPSTRMGSCMCSLLNGLIIFGGRKNPSQCFNDIYFYDLSSERYLPVKILSTSVPQARWNSSITIVSETLAVIYGGRNSDSLFGDCWSVHFTRENDEIQATWFCLYDSSNTIYNANQSPGPRFGVSLLPLCVKGTDSKCTHDHVFVMGGQRSLLGEYTDSSIYMFKLSKRQWFSVSVTDETNEFNNIINYRIANIASNTFLLVGTHSKSLQSTFLKLSIEPMQAHFSPISISTEYPSNEPILTGFTCEVVDGKLYLLGGGGTYFWMNMFNHSLFVADDLLREKGSSACSLREASKQQKRKAEDAQMPAKQNQNQDCVLVMHDSKKLKQVKQFLEEHHQYDKTRKITKLDSGDFGIPVRCRDYFESCEDVPEDLKTILTADNIASTSLKATSNMKLQTNQILSEFVEDLKLHRFEVVGDILVLNKLSCSGKSWENLWKEMSEMPSCITNENKETHLAPMFTKLLKLYGCDRIGIHDEIDCGPKRQSHSCIIFSQKKEEDGWVTVRQNGVLYSWPFERVMFASGNNTERMRMGKVKAKDEFVVDLYAGIGYFTIPIAVKSGAKHVLCFEINEDSVSSLRRNAIQNGVNDICEIILGDNREMTKPYHDIADRVLLGLLPSSREGWPLAMQVLKENGGMLHVHENVHDDEFEIFSKTLPEELEKLGRNKGKEYKCTIVHVEKVKSYAPKVYHYVFDVECQKI